MCGRLTIVLDAAAYQLEFDLHMDESVRRNWKALYNVAPGQLVPVVKDPNGRSLEFMRWGLMPLWAKDEKAGIRLINVRAETILEKATFRKLMQQGQRCLIFADGFYEWQAALQKGTSPTPYYFHLKDGKPFAFAGLWENGFTPEKQPLTTCAIITCAPNTLMSSVHHRMPVILNASMAWEWLAPKPGVQLAPLLKPYPGEEMVAYPVSSMVNSTAVNEPGCIQPAE